MLLEGFFHHHVHDNTCFDLLFNYLRTDFSSFYSRSECYVLAQGKLKNFFPLVPLKTHSFGISEISSCLHSHLTLVRDNEKWIKVLKNQKHFTTAFWKHSNGIQKQAHHTNTHAQISQLSSMAEPPFKPLVPLCHPPQPMGEKITSAQQRAQAAQNSGDISNPTKTDKKPWQGPWEVGGNERNWWKKSYVNKRVSCSSCLYINLKV